MAKAEFEALKKDFNDQITNYNSSIDSKIDGAIANYLAGIKLEKKVALTNIFDELGGRRIYFGRPSFFEPKEPKTGWGVYFLNSYSHGFTRLNGGAGWGGIKNPASSDWTNAASGGQTGTFILYETVNGNKYLNTSKREMLQAVYIGGWYSGTNYRNVTQEYPFGSNPTVFKQPITVGSNYGIDCYTSTYRPYTLSDWTALRYYTGAWDVESTNTRYTIDMDEYNLPSNYRTVSDLYVDTYTGDGTVDYTGKITISFSNIRVYAWKWTLDAFSNFSPAFLKGTKYNTKLYGGVPFFEVEKEGEVEVSKLKFRHTANTTSFPYVYFAISDSPFANSSSLSSSVKLTELKNCSIESASQNLYKAAVGAEVSFKLDASTRGTYYIKCQYTTTKPSSSDSLYSYIEDGAEINYVEGL